MLVSNRPLYKCFCYSSVCYLGSKFTNYHKNIVDIIKLTFFHKNYNLPLRKFLLRNCKTGHLIGKIGIIVLLGSMTHLWLKHYLVAGSKPPVARRPLWDPKDHKKGMKNTFQGKVYNFLERPTGWKCFVYHFTV